MRNLMRFSLTLLASLPSFQAFAECTANAVVLTDPPTPVTTICQCVANENGWQLAATDFYCDGTRNMRMVTNGPFMFSGQDECIRYAYRETSLGKCRRPEYPTW